jgi:hypothetical protein
VGIFGKDDEPAGESTVVAMDDDSATVEATAGNATSMIERLMDVGIDGKGRFDSAQRVADVAIAEHSGDERAIDGLVRSHLKLGAAGGFVTSLGGFVTMPIALPANVLGFYLVATRMVAGIASIRGYDIRKPEVRSAVLLALVGADADDLLNKLPPLPGVSTGRLANLAAQRLPGPALIAVNKGIGFRLLTQVGRKSLTRFGKAVPLVGGVVGAGVDSFLLKRIADHARQEFPPKARLLT